MYKSIILSNTCSTIVYCYIIIKLSVEICTARVVTMESQLINFTFTTTKDHS